MKSPIRVVAVSLWLAPVVVCVVYSLFKGFTHESYGAAIAIHNGLNPQIYGHEESGIWISLVLTGLVLGYVVLTKKRKIGDFAFLSFVVLSYIFAGIQFMKNFHAG